MDLAKMLTDAMTDKVVWEISSKMWMSWDSAKSAIEWALPMLLGGLSKNADTPEWVSSLNGALGKHSWGVMDMIWDLAGNPDSWEGAGILKHILWWSEENVAQAVAKKAWINSSQAGWLLKVLAPMVMGKLWEAKSWGLDVGSLLQKDTMAKWLLNSFLDKDGDGDIKDDLLSMWMNFAKKKFFG